MTANVIRLARYEVYGDVGGPEPWKRVLVEEIAACLARGPDARSARDAGAKDRPQCETPRDAEGDMFDSEVASFDPEAKACAAVDEAVAFCDLWHLLKATGKVDDVQRRAAAQSQ